MKYTFYLYTLLIAFMSYAAFAQIKVPYLELTTGKKYRNLTLEREDMGFFYFRDSNNRQIMIPALQIPDDRRNSLSNSLNKKVHAPSQTLPPPPTGTVIRVNIETVISNGFLASQCEIHTWKFVPHRSRSRPDKYSRMGALYGRQLDLSHYSPEWVVRPGNLAIIGLNRSELVKGEIWTGDVVEVGIKEYDGQNYRTYRVINTP